MRTYTTILLLLSLFISCNESKVKEKNPLLQVPIQSDNKETKSTTLNFRYNYPENIISSRNEENRVEFYPIGFSPEGNFAYINRPCDGGCGCCTHDIIIQDLLTDKIETQLSLAPTEEMGTQSHLESWNKNFSKVEKALKLKGISQSSLQIRSSSSFIDDITSHKYDIKINKKVKENEYSAEQGGEMSYSVYVTIDNGKTKRITKGVFQYAYDLEYLGYIRSPYSDMIAVVLNKKQRGFEGDINDDVVVVGCHLDPSFY